MKSKKIYYFFFLLIVLSGCTPQMLGVMLGHVTGDTIKEVSKSSNTITLQYTHTYADELAAASQYADNWCNQQKKRAVLIQNTRYSVDRSTVTFSCS